MSLKGLHKFKPLYTLYQPIIEVGTQKILGYEALTRGRQRPRLPQHLFRSAYEKGSAIEVDLDCLREAFRILPSLRKNKILFVNIEPITISRSFHKGKEGDFLLKNISAYGPQIVFELTEGMKTRDFELIKKGVAFMRKGGFRFALDDVAGIGHKLLSLLSLKPDFIKIDMSLVRGLKASRFQQEMVRRIMDLAKKHDSIPIAEGVEEKKEADFVEKLGIPYAQGFYFSFPKKGLSKKDLL